MEYGSYQMGHEKRKGGGMNSAGGVCYSFLPGQSEWKDRQNRQSQRRRHVRADPGALAAFLAP